MAIKQGVTSTTNSVKQFRQALAREHRSFDPTHTAHDNRGLSVHNAERRIRVANVFSAFYMKDTPPSIYDQWDNRRHAIETTVSLIMLAHAFLQDDGEISSRENRIIRRVIRKNKQKLLQEDLMDILDILDRFPNQQVVMEYFLDKHISIEQVRSLSTKVLQYLKYSSRYSKCIRELCIQYELVAKH